MVEEGPLTQIFKRILPGLGLTGLIAGAFIHFIASQEQGILDRTDETPFRKSLGQVLREGPGSNHHIEFTGFRFADEYMVRSKAKIFWTGVAIELIPDGQGQGGPIQAVAFFGKVRGQRAMDTLIREGKLTGLVLNGIPNPPTYNGAILAKLLEGRPGSDMDTVLRIDGDPNLPNQSMVDMLWMLSYVALFGGVVCFLGLFVAMAGGEDDEDEAAAAPAAPPPA